MKNKSKPKFKLILKIVKQKIKIKINLLKKLFV